MAQVPSVDAPSVGQSGAPVNVSAPADAFGANVIAGGLDKIGQALGADSDMLEKHAEQFQAINNQVESDKGFVNNLQQLDQLRENFKANNQGMLASQNLPAFLKQAETQRAAIGATMSNPSAAVLYNSASRRALQNTTSELTTFAVQQRQQEIEKTYAAKQDANVGQAISNYANDPASFDRDAVPQIMADAGAYAQSHGFTEEVAADFARKTISGAVTDMTKIISGNGDIVGAKAFLDAHKDMMDPKAYAQETMQLKPGLIANDAAEIGHAAVTDALHGLNSSVGPSVDYLSAVHAREGDGKNPRSSANGIGQFTQGTWLQVLKTDPDFSQDIKGKTDAQILAMRQDPAVANRAILSYAQENSAKLSAAGLPVNSATVGLAHGFGSGDATKLLTADPGAPASSILSAKVMAANPDLKGQTAGQIVNSFQQRFGTGSSDGNVNGTPTSYQLASREQAVLALVHNGVVAKYGENAQIEDMARSKAIAELNSQVTAAKNLETSAYTTLGSFAMNNQIQDLPTLLKSVPNGYQAYNSLPLSQRTQLQADIHQNATELTGPRLASVTALDGMWGSRTENPQAFLNADISHMDLTQSDRLKWMQKQADFRGKPQTAVDPEAKAMGQIVKMPEYKSVMGSDGLNIKANSDEEFLLRGAIAGQLTNWFAANPGKSPQQKDILPMIAQATAQHSMHWDFLGHNMGPAGTEQHLPEISDEDKEGITKALTRHGIPVSPYTIGKYYSMARGGQ